MSMLEVLVLKNLIQRTSQHLKWTSGARDMILGAWWGGRISLVRITSPGNYLGGSNFEF